MFQLPRTFFLLKLRIFCQTFWKILIKSNKTNCFSPLQDREFISLNLNSSDITSYPNEWQMGATSSCINDIANDDFVPILNIEEVSDQDNKLSNRLTVPAIHESASDHSISNILELFESKNENTENSFLAVPTSINPTELKSSGSDISISFFLDGEQSSDIYDENSFANVNSNSLNVSHRKESLSREEYME